MRCPACDAENPGDAARCAACDKRLPRRRGRRGADDEADVPPDPVAERRNGAAWFAFRVSFVGLIPGVGLVVGPLAAVLGLVARARGRGVAGFTAGAPATAAVILGVLISATQWAGAALMAYARSAPP